MTFETLIYTDCVPGQGLAGTAGLQFQAKSSGADRAAQQLVGRSLLYEPPDVWMRERRPVADYPPSFAHIHDQLYATAAGVYLGKEANGGREGNQLTHSIVTREPDAYGLTRPAQLFGAPFWTSVPAPTTSCPAIEEWEPGPFDADAARDVVLADPRGRERLVALVSALDRIGTPLERRVLFIAENAGAVLGWIAAATMLIPQRRALEIGFKVFTLRPAYAPQPIVAVHPAWGSSTVSVANDSGYVVFDLAGGDFTVVEPTDQAQRRVDLLCSPDNDPYDVLDVIEYASRVGRSPKDNFDLAVAVRWPGSMAGELARLAVHWLRESDPELLPDCRRSLVDQLCDRVERWDRDILVDLDAVAAAGQVPGDQIPAVRLALIRAEIDRVTRNPAARTQTVSALSPDVWHPAHVREAEDLMAGALAGASRHEVFEGLLRLARQLDLGVPLDRLAASVDVFVDDWADHPEHPYRPELWVLGEQLNAALMRVLRERVAMGFADEVGDAWWKQLEPGIDRLESDLDRAVVAAAMAHGSPEKRLELVRQFITGSRRAGRTGMVERAAGVLWIRVAPTEAELRELCVLLPAGPLLPLRLFDGLRADLFDPAAELTKEKLDLARELARCGLYQPTVAVRDLLIADEQLARICRDLPTHPDVDVVTTYPDILRGAEERLKDLYASRLADAILQADEPRWAEVLVHAANDKGYRVLMRKLQASLGSTTPYKDLRVGFYLAYSQVVDAESQVTLRAACVAAISRSGDKRLKPIAAAMDKLGGKWPRRWDDAVEESKKPSILSRLRGGGKG